MLMPWFEYQFENINPAQPARADRLLSGGCVLPTMNRRGIVLAGLSPGVLQLPLASRTAS